MAEGPEDPSPTGRKVLIGYTGCEQNFAQFTKFHFLKPFLLLLMLPALPGFVRTLFLGVLGIPYMREFCVAKDAEVASIKRKPAASCHGPQAAHEFIPEVHAAFFQSTPSHPFEVRVLLKARI